MITISRGRVALARAAGAVPSTKKILSIAMLGLLCACGGVPVTTTSFNGVHTASAPTSKDDPRLGQPRFHRDEGGGGAWWTDAGTPGID